MATAPVPAPRREGEGAVRSYGQDERPGRSRSGRDKRRRDDRRLGEEVGVVEGVAHNVANDVNALVQAWSEANAEVFKGLVSVVGSLLLDVNRSRPSRGGTRRGQRRPSGGASAAEDRDPDRGYERDQDRDEVEETEEYGDSVTRVSRSLSDAINDAASIVQRAGDRFQRRYERAARGEDDEEDEREERDERPARPERKRRGEGSASADQARDRQYRETTGERSQDLADKPPPPTSGVP